MWFPVKLTVLPVDLILRDDDLAGIGIAGVLDRVAHDADNSNDLTNLLGLVLDVAWVANQLLTARNLTIKKNDRE